MMLRLKRLATAACAASHLALAACSGGPTSAQPGTPNARATELLDKVRSTYAATASYSDEGELVVSDADEPFDRVKFKTSFVRSQSFRFEFASEVSVGSLVSRGGIVEESVNGKSERGTTIEDGVLGLAGISYGASTAIPMLLLGKDFWSQFEVRNIRIEKAIEHQYVVVEMSKPTKRGGTEFLTIWIDPVTDLIRRIEEQDGSGKSIYSFTMVAR